MKRNQLLSLAILSSTLVLGASPAFASDAFDGVRMLTQQDANHTKAIRGSLTIDGASQNLTFSTDKQSGVTVPFAEITSMRVDTTVTRLHRPFTGRVEQQQFLTVQYANPEGKHNYAVFRLKSSSYRETVAALEADTGKTVEQVSK